MIANNMYPALSLAPVVIVCSNLAPLTTIRRKNIKNFYGNGNYDDQLQKLQLSVVKMKMKDEYLYTYIYKL